METINQSINIPLLRHDRMQANKLKDKHDKKNSVYMGKETSGLI